VIATSAGLSLLYWWLFQPENVRAESEEDDIFESFGNEVKGLPSYKMEEVSKHDSKEKRIWVTFKSGVYDVTDFVDSHPGGDKIMMAAGASVDVFWELYAIHKNKNVLAILESYRIGNLDEKDRETTHSTVDHWSQEPVRHRLLTPRSKKPFNAEPPPSLLADSHLTPNPLFFVRNHLPVPVVEEKDYRLEIQGIGLKKSVSISLEELKTKFPTKTVTTTIQCAGNRRSEMNKVKEVKGLFWSHAAISTASWKGALLKDVLKYYKIDLNQESLKHIQFEGMDLDPVQGTCYGASIPIEKYLLIENDIILAFEMNGQPIPRDHGFPVRVIIPGVVGARQVKWLSKIILSNEESKSHWQQKDYKGFNSSIDASNADWDAALAIQDYPVQSAFCQPEEGDNIKKDKEGFITVKGYAWSGGGRAITRVDISSDDGKTWIEATLKPGVDRDNLNRKYDWTLWEARLPVTKKSMTLICKATDSSYSTQPEKFDFIWNFRGVLSNAWHRINITVTD
jgi:sulfite oxidase